MTRRRVGAVLAGTLAVLFGLLGLVFAFGAVVVPELVGPAAMLLGSGVVCGLCAPVLWHEP